jgi:hypothetical protein
MAMLRDRTVLVRAMDARLSDLDALVLPTTPIVAPAIAEVSSSEGFTAKNGLVLRNPAIVNFFDLCAISLPLPRGRAAGWTDARRAQQPRSQVVPNGGCGRTPFCSVTDVVLIRSGLKTREPATAHRSCRPSRPLGWDALTASRVYDFLMVASRGVRQRRFGVGRESACLPDSGHIIADHPSIGAPDNNPLRSDGDKFGGHARPPKNRHLVGQGGDGSASPPAQVPNQMSAAIAIAQMATATAAFSSPVNGMMETLIK